MLPIASSARPVRVAFVGQASFFASVALDGPVPGIEPVFVDYRQGEDFDSARSALDGWEPDCVVVFRPELIPPGALDGLDVTTLGFMTEPLPRGRGRNHPDLARRRAVLSALDPAAFDRLITFDPLIVPTVEEVAPVWRSLPLPVADRFFGPIRDPDDNPKSIFTGRSTEHRETYLTPAKHQFDTLHIAHGADGDRLEELLRECLIGLNLHNEPYPTFEQRVPTYLAAGLLVITEPLSPTHGLEPGLDYVEVHSPAELEQVLFAATHYFEAFRRIRIRGRAKAEGFRASTVWPRLISDLAADLRAFGTVRAALA